MRNAASFFVLLGVLFLLACGGGGGNMTTTNPPPFIIMSGNFSMTATSQTVSNTIFIGGAIQSDSSGHVTATMHTNDINFSCFDNISGITLTGSLSPQGQLSLTSSSINGQTLTISAMVSSDGKTISNGTYSVSGNGCLPTGDHGTLTGAAVQLVAGTFNGSFSMNGSTINTSLAIKQGPAGPDGSFSITASATFTNSAACGGFTSAGSEGGSQTGLFVSTQMVPNTGATIITFSGLFTDATEHMINGSFVVHGGLCDQMKGPVVMTSQ
ncbi:MAG TPA: hypothetical protein VKD65_01055 [Candidatus Angelobacter sp.]|nr:hypothetical protein [Candidatus Angelobacter sp.]